jgi:hypothetical protein
MVRIVLSDEGRWLSQRRRDTEMSANAIETVMRDGISRIIYGIPDPDPLWLCASVREDFSL